MKLLHNATIITAEKVAVGSILIVDGKISDIIYKDIDKKLNSGKYTFKR